MRRAIAILLLCSLSVHCAGRLGIVANWWLNRDYVARVLCINRAKPQLRCNGKCHLAKQLKAADAAEQQRQPLGGKQAFGEITLFWAAAVPLRLEAPRYFAQTPRYAALRVATYGRTLPGPKHPPA